MKKHTFKNLQTPRIILSGIILLLSSNVYSAEDVASQVSKTDVINSSTKMAETSFSTSMNSSYLIQLILGLLVVVLCVVVLAWFAKKMNKFNSTTNDSLKIISGISMGAREKIILLQAGDEQILVGVAQGNINRLHVLENPLEETNITSANNGLVNKFKEIMDDASASNKNNK